MQIVLEFQLLFMQIDKGSQKTGPHIEKIQAVKGMGDHQETSRQRIGMGIPFQDDHKDKARHAAGPSIEHGAGQPADGKIISHQGTGGDHDHSPVIQDTVYFAGVKGGDDRRDQQKCGKSKGDPVDDLAVCRKRKAYFHINLPKDSLNISYNYTIITFEGDAFNNS